MNYVSFGKTLDEILHFDHIRKLTTFGTSLWSSYTKQWHMLWILKSYFKYVILINCIYQDDGQALPNVIKSLIWESVITSAVLRILFGWQFLFQSRRMFGAMWSIILYEDYLLRHPKARLDCECKARWSRVLFLGAWDDTGCGFCDTSPAQEQYSTDNGMMVTGLVVPCVLFAHYHQACCTTKPHQSALGPVSS